MWRQGAGAEAFGEPLWLQMEKKEGVGGTGAGEERGGGENIAEDAHPSFRASSQTVSWIINLMV